MDQVYVFDKSFQERLQEYLDVLSGHNILPVSNIKKEWAFFLELSLDANGWQAVWKIPRAECEQYKIPFPTIVLVYVEDTHFDELEAVAKILAVQDDISIPDEHIIPLIQLWPTKAQDKTVVLNMQSTANALDLLRFFYINLIMPWDYEDEDTSDWLSKHLESRLRLYYDMRTGLIPRTVSENIRALFVECRRLQAQRENLEMEIGDETAIEINNYNVENVKIQNLMDLHVRLVQIKGEIEILENPLMRHVILKQQEATNPKRGTSIANYWIICDPGKLSEHILFLKQIEQYYPNETFKFASNLPDTLDEMSFDDVIILNKSKYNLKNVAKLEHRGTLKGIYENDITVIISQSEDIMLDIGGEVVIENIKFDAALSQCGILVRRGKLILKNCTLVGDTKSSTHQGIIVLGDSHLDIMDCDISGFATAIVGNSGSHISIKKSKIHKVNVGVKAYDDCIISVQKSRFMNCKDYGFCVETEKVVDPVRKIGGFDVLKTIPDINIDELNGDNNGKADVVINNSQKIIPMKDLFTNLDLTYSNKANSVTEDEDMEVTNEGLDDTIIENSGIRQKLNYD